MSDKQNEWWKLTQFIDSTAQRKRILVVDDQLHTRLLLKTLFAEEDYQVECAENAVSALYLAEHHLPHLIIIDLILMDRVDGLMLCKQLRALPALNNSLIYVLSGMTDTQTKFDVLLAGANDFIEKPFSPIDLLERVSRIRSTYGK